MKIQNFTRNLAYVIPKFLLYTNKKNNIFFREITIPPVICNVYAHTTADFHGFLFLFKRAEGLSLIALFTFRYSEYYSVYRTMI